VRLHLGANQVTVQVLLGESAHDVPSGEKAYAVLRCAKPIVADYAQPFILRQLSPERTIGGGTIVAPTLRPSDRVNRCLALAEALSDAQPSARLEAYVALCGEATFDDATQSRIGLDRGQFGAAARRLVDERALVWAPGSEPRYVTSARFDELRRRTLQCCQAELSRRQPARLLPLSVIRSAMTRHASPGVLEAVLADLTARGELVRRDDRVGLSGTAELSHRQRRLLDGLLGECVAAGSAPPTLKEFAARHGLSLKELETLVQVAVDESRLVRLSPEMVIDSQALDGLRQDLVDYFHEHRSAKIGEIRQRWGITRKHAVPIFEFFDRQQITARSGDFHTAGPRISDSVVETIQ
jgi:selenocysteine-specific elongation factor